MGKTTAAAAIAVRHGASVVLVDVIWMALKAATTPQSHPELHYFDPSSEELALAPESLCERHIASARAISLAMDPVIEYLLREGRPVVLEGAWITPRRRTALDPAVRGCASCVYPPAGRGRCPGGHAEAPAQSGPNTLHQSDHQGLLALWQLGTGTGSGRGTAGGRRYTARHVGRARSCHCPSRLADVPRPQSEIFDGGYYLHQRLTGVTKQH